MNPLPDGRRPCNICGWLSESKVLGAGAAGRPPVTHEADLSEPFGLPPVWNSGVRLPFDVLVRLVADPPSSLEPFHLELRANGASFLASDPQPLTDLTIAGSYCCITRWLHGHLRLGRLVASGGVADLDIGIAGLVTASVGPGSNAGVAWDLDRVDRHIAEYFVREGLASNAG